MSLRFRPYKFRRILPKSYKACDTIRPLFLLVNFPFMSSNIPSAPAYGVYVSQLVRYARACCNYEDFVDRGKLLTSTLLSQGYRRAKLVST